LALAGACSAGSEGDGASSAPADYLIAEGAPAEAPPAGLGYDIRTSDEQSSLSGGAVASDQKDASPVASAATDQRSVIKTGNVALRSADVATARFDVGKVLDAHGGEIAEENTQADDNGEAERVRLVLRVPVDEFDATMTGLKGVADLIDVTTKTQDVSTEVIDNDVRVALQQRSIDRISILLDSAADLRDIVSIERELSQREADLGSLEKRQAYLADQTAMATITVSIEPPHATEKTDSDDESGFLAGLEGGWTALGDVTTGLLTVGGAVLPFVLVLLALGLPARLLLQRVGSRRPGGAAPVVPSAPTA
ncbi:MAG: DUF4349 domain-containing protein, partial [Nocardioides sp.]